MVKNKRSGELFEFINEFRNSIILIAAILALFSYMSIHLELFKKHIELILFVIFLLFFFLIVLISYSLRILKGTSDEIMATHERIIQVVLSLNRVLPEDKFIELTKRVGMTSGIPYAIKESSYIFLEEEGERDLPEELKKMIDDLARKGKIKSTNDALTLCNKIGKEKFIEIAARSRLKFPEIVALSVLYTIKVSENIDFLSENEKAQFEYPHEFEELNKKIEELSSGIKYVKNIVEPKKPIEKVERLEETEIKTDILRTALAITHYFTEKYEDERKFHGVLEKFTGQSSEETNALMLKLLSKSLIRNDALIELLEKQGVDLEQLKEVMEKTEMDAIRRIAKSNDFVIYKDLTTAINLTKIGKYEEALSLYNSVIERTPAESLNLGALFNKGTTLLKLKKYRDAIECFNKVTKINPNSKGAWLNTGVSYHGLNNLEEEKKCYDIALKIDQTYTKALFNKATLLMEKGKREEARKYYEETFKIDPNLISDCPPEFILEMFIIPRSMHET